MVPAQSDEPGSTHTVQQLSFLLFLQVIVVKIPSISLSHSENAQNQSYLSQKKANKLFHLFPTCHSIRAIKTPSMHTSINTTNQTELWWSSGYRDTTIVKRTRFNSGCRSILCFLFLQPLVVKIPSIILWHRENAENQSYLSKKKSKQAFPLIPHVPQHKSN